MVWPIVAAAVIGGVKAYLGAGTARATAQANQRISDATANAKGKIRQAENAYEASRLALSTLTQSMNNARALEAGASQLEANSINARRQGDAALGASIEDQIGMAEQNGAQTAMAALHGVAGSVVQDVQISSGLRQARARYDADSARDMTNWDTARRASGIMQQTLQSMDNGRQLASLNYTQEYSQQFASVNPWRAAVLGAAEGAFNAWAGGGGGGGAPPAKSGSQFSFGSPRLGTSTQGSFAGSTSGVRFGGPGPSVRLGG